MNELGNLYFSYKNKYPMYNQETIIDKMLDDGVIDFASADKIRKGVGLFNYFKTKKTEGEINFSQIFGLQLSKDVTFNQEIEPTKQPMTQGDCWLLSDINALSYKEWGKQAIREAIIPDEDGNGVTIRFKGSPLANKDIHVTKERILEARKSGNYSSGDDDMIAFELATEDTFRQMVKQGLATRCETDEIMQYNGAKYRSYIWLGVKTEDFDQYPVSKLLGINVFEFDKFNGDEIHGIEDYTKKVLKYLSNHQNSIAANCGFSFFMGGWGDENSQDYIHGGHAYAIKKINYDKNVIVTDPHYSDYDIKVPWEVFLESLGRIDISFKDAKTEKELTGLVPKDFAEQIKKSKEDYQKMIKELHEKHQRVRDSIASSHKFN